METRNHLKSDAIKGNSCEQEDFRRDHRVSIELARKRLWFLLAQFKPPVGRRERRCSVGRDPVEFYYPALKEGETHLGLSRAGRHLHPRAPDPETRRQLMRAGQKGQRGAPVPPMPRELLAARRTQDETASGCPQS